MATKDTEPKQKEGKCHKYSASNHMLTKHVSIRRGRYQETVLMGGEKTEMTGDASSSSFSILESNNLISRTSRSIIRTQMFVLAATIQVRGSFNICMRTLTHPGLRSLGNIIYDHSLPGFFPLAWLMFGTPQGAILGPLDMPICISVCCDF